MSIDEVLQRCKSDNIYLAPPQLYMLKQIQKYGSNAKFVRSVANIDWPKFIQPKLVSSNDGIIWHSILPKDWFYNKEQTAVDNILNSKGPF